MTQNEKIAKAADLGLKLRTFINAIETPSMPELPEKVGYKWELAYTFGNNSFTWISVPDPEAKGTKDNPIEWVSGMSTLINAWYIFEGELYVCVQSGSPTEITDNEYFEKM